MDTDMSTPDLRIMVTFRVLIVGRANAGKTSILQRVSGSTESPVICRKAGKGYDSDELIQLDPTTERGEHNIYDEILFTKHPEYVFHDSCGIESGSDEELKIVQNFVREKSTAKRLKDRLHAIWYCIPTDDERPSLNMRHLHNICPDRNVPVIALFTKYDQFRFNIEMNLEDSGLHDWKSIAPAEVEKVFQKRYQCHLDGQSFVRLEKMHETDKRCIELLEVTASALNDDAVAIMLLALQRDNQELSIKSALGR